jgi:hypothetical protein
MDGEIVLNRDGTNIMKLDDNEQAMLDEIEIEIPNKRVSTSMRRPMQRHDIQEDIDSFANPNKHRPQPDYNQPPPQDDDDDAEDHMEYGEMEEEEEQPEEGYSSIDEEKVDILNKLARLEKKGFTINKRLNMYSPISDLRAELKRITYTIEVDKSVKFSRRMLIACVTGIEFMNKRYNPFDVQLEGWSENVMENVDDYDEVFEELYVKYRSKMKMAPEVKLIMMLGGSAMMFHLTNSMFKTAIPNMNDVLKQNPGLVQNMMSAVQNTIQNQGAPPPSRPSSGEYEMQGPGMDISSLMGNIMMPPPPPMSTSQLRPPPPKAPSVNEDDDDAISDIVSIKGDEATGEDGVKEVTISDPSKKSRGRGRPKKKAVEINI